MNLGIEPHEHRQTFVIDDMRCVACGNNELRHQLEGDAPDTVVCTRCAREYKRSLGVYFFGDFEKEDVLGLIEIAANIVNRGNFGIDPPAVEEWEDLLSQYDAASDKPAFLRTVSPDKAPYFPNRYGEWLEVTTLARNLDLAGKDVLDVGAGLGFDSHRLALRGARVTALEFSPLLAESGQVNFPHIRWVGGFSHCLPFKDCSFDAVFCNAALHHMRDIPAAISEALRVLRTGGTLITTCDSFRSSDSPTDAELDIFDADTAVLLGVNEGVPRFSDFVSAFTAHPETVDVELYTHTLYGARGESTLTDLTKWNYPSDLSRLGARSGSVAMKVALKERWPEAARQQTAGIVAADTYACWMESAATALGRLTPLLPANFVDLPFPGKRSSKFELLNGWRRPLPHRQSRTAYHRGRWFLTAPASPRRLDFEVSRTAGSAVNEIRLLLNGVERQQRVVPETGWVPVSIDLRGLEPGQTFCVEIQQTGSDRSLAGASFDVRHRRVLGSSSHAAATGASVYVVVPVFNRLHFTRSCIADLKAQTYAPLHVVISDGGSTDGTVDAVRAEFPDVTVLATDKELWWTGSMQMGIAHVLERTAGADGYVLMLNNDTKLVEDYIEKLVAASREFDAAVCGLIVDSRNPDRILDAGEYIDWENYAFPLKSSIEPDDSFIGDVDVLPGRGSLVPLHMIRKAGNVDADLLPHYLADYEFFYRLKRAGFSLGVSCETKILAHIDQTGIIPTGTRTTLAQIWREAFSRRSMSNVVDHWRFVSRHAPAELRAQTRKKLIRRLIVDFTLRSELRFLFLPFLRLTQLSRRVFNGARGQWLKLDTLRTAIQIHGWNVVCWPREFPAFLRAPVYLLLSPGPISEDMVAHCGLEVNRLLAGGMLRKLEHGEWFALQAVLFGEHPQARNLARLRLMAWNPIRKVANTLAWRKARLAAARAL